MEDVAPIGISALRGQAGDARCLQAGSQVCTADPTCILFSFQNKVDDSGVP